MGRTLTGLLSRALLTSAIPFHRSTVPPSLRPRRLHPDRARVRDQLAQVLVEVTRHGHRGGVERNLPHVDLRGELRRIGGRDLRLTVRERFVEVIDHFSLRRDLLEAVELRVEL